MPPATCSECGVWSAPGSAVGTGEAGHGCWRGPQVDAEYVDHLMKEVWMNSAKGSAVALDESLDEFVTLDELRKALAL